MKDIESEIEQAVLKRQNEIAEARQILLEKLKEMSKIEFEGCANGEYPEICSTMNEIVKTLLDK